MCANILNIYSDFDQFEFSSKSQTFPHDLKLQKYCHNTANLGYMCTFTNGINPIFDNVLNLSKAEGGRLEKRVF